MFINRLAIIGGLASLIVLLSSTSVYAKYNAIAPPGDDDDIWVMTFNVENLFDAEHDDGKRDWFFLPKNYPGKQKMCMQEPSRYRQRCLNMDWTRDKVALKLDQKRRLFDAIGGRPDILGIQEIENEKMVRALARTLGYGYYLFHDADDKRGIDVALLYNDERVELINWKSRSPNSPDFDRPTRDILTGFFEVKATGDTLAVYVNHWPSQAAPAPKRVAVARKLKEFMDDDRQEYDNYHGLVIGDFNTVPDDWPHPHRDVITHPNWRHNLLDIIEEAKSARALPWDFPLGSYFYYVKMLWQHLDKMFATQNLMDGRGLDVDLDSYDIHRTELGTHTFIYDRDTHPQYGSEVTGVPLRYNHSTWDPEEAGYSDHLPVSVMVRVN